MVYLLPPPKKVHDLPIISSPVLSIHYHTCLEKKFVFINQSIGYIRVLFIPYEPIIRVLSISTGEQVCLLLINSQFKALLYGYVIIYSAVVTLISLKYIRLPDKGGGGGARLPQYIGGSAAQYIHDDYCYFIIIHLKKQVGVELYDDTAVVLFCVTCMCALT